MEPLTWTGSIALLNPLLMIAIAALLVSIVVWILGSIILPETPVSVNIDGTISSGSGLRALTQKALQFSFAACVALALAYIVLGILMGTSAGIIGAISQQFLPVWLSLVILFAMSIAFKRKLGLYGKLFDSPIGMIGFGLVMFWVFTGIFGAMDLIITHDPLDQVSGMKNKIPGTPVPSAEEGEYAWYLLGGDNLARDVFSRMVKGAWIVVQIAPLATMFAFMVGITLGLPAGFYGGRLDTFLSFLANLILAFPVILLFYLLVTPEIVATGVPNYMAAVLFVFQFFSLRFC